MDFGSIHNLRGGSYEDLEGGYPFSMIAIMGGGAGWLLKIPLKPETWKRGHQNT